MYDLSKVRRAEYQNRTVLNRSDQILKDTLDESK